MKGFWRMFILLLFIGINLLVQTKTARSEVLELFSPSEDAVLTLERKESEGIDALPPPIDLMDTEQTDLGGSDDDAFSKDEPIDPESGARKSANPDKLPEMNADHTESDVSEAFKALFPSLEVENEPTREDDEPSKNFISLRKQGERFFMEFRDAEIKEVLRALSQENDLNIIVGEDVEGTITLSFKSVTFDDAFNAILHMNHLNATRDGNIVHVIKSQVSTEETGLVTKVIGINFAIVDEIQETVKGILSKKGVVMADTRTNTLVVRDFPPHLEKIARVVQRLDSETPQIMIEARIVEVDTNFSRELGVQWGGQLSSRSGNTTTTVHGGGFKDRSDDLFSQPLSGGIGFSGGPFAVNLPADVGRGRGGGFGFSIGNVANTRLLDVQLSALEDAGNGKILSNPVIMTLNKKEASISSGTEILIPTTSIVTTSISSSADASGGTANTGVTTINAKLELKVTSHVIFDDQIMIHVRVDKKDVDFSREVQGIPPLTTRTAETNLLVKDRETIVIGGIYTHRASDGEAGVPWLSKIPVLGWFFKKETKLDTQNELMIFITPTIRRGDEVIDETMFERNKN